MGLILGKRLPVVEGTIAVDGVHETVRIRRDAYGVPYINAENAADAWFGLGFCQGQDRSWQLESCKHWEPGPLRATPVKSS
jgi:penicillin amidase